MSTTTPERYFQNGGTTYGYDPTQTALIAAAVAAGWTEVTGAWPPPPAPPTLAQQAEQAVYAGLTITLSGSLVLAATLFPTDRLTQTKVLSVMTVLGKTGAFPGGALTYPLKDATGTWHVLSVAQYETVATAIGSYVSALDLIADGNPTLATSLPPSAIELTV